MQSFHFVSVMSFFTLRYAFHMIQVQLSFFSIFFTKKFSPGIANSFHFRLYLSKASSSGCDGSAKKERRDCKWMHQQKAEEERRMGSWHLWIPYPQLIEFLCTDTQKPVLLSTTVLFKEVYTMYREKDASLFTQIYFSLAFMLLYSLKYTFLLHFLSSISNNLFSTCIYMHTYKNIATFVKHTNIAQVAL